MTRKKSEGSAGAEQAPADVEVRVLADCRFGKVNDVVRISAPELEQALALGLLDAHPDAVSYAKTLA